MHEKRPVNPYLINVLVAAICVLVVVLYGVSVPETEAWDWWHTLVGTTISILLGITAGILLYRYQNQLSNHSRKEQLRWLLASEVESCLVALVNTEPLQIGLSAGVLRVKPVMLQSAVLEDAVRSGLFDDATVGMMDLVREIQLHNWQLEQLFAVMGLGTRESCTVAAYYEARIKAQQHQIQGSMQGMVKAMRLPLKQPLDMGSRGST